MAASCESPARESGWLFHSLSSRGEVKSDEGPERSQDGGKMSEKMDDWQFWCDGMHIARGLKQVATNGYMGIDASGELVLFNNKGEEAVRAPITEVEAKLKTWYGDTVIVQGKKYHLEFAPLGRAALERSFGAIGGLVAGALASRGEDKRSPNEKRDDFARVVAQLQGQV